MQYIDGYTPGASASVVDALVRVNGVNTPVESVKIDSVSGGNIPGGEALSEVFQTTAEIVFSPETVYMTGDEKHGSPARPRKGDSITVDTVENGVTIRQMTGRIKSTSITPGGPLVADVEDNSWKLRRRFTMPAVLTNHPPLVDGEANVTKVNISGLFILDRAMRLCGYYATPPQMPGAFLSVPLMGSGFPERSRLIDVRDSARSGYAGFGPTLWGVKAVSLWGRYKPTFQGGQGPFTQNMEISALVPSSSGTTGGAEVTVWWAEDSWLALRINANRQAFLVTCVGGTTTYSADVRLDPGDARVGVQITPAGAYDLRATVDGAETARATGTIPTAQAWRTTAPAEARISTNSAAPPLSGVMAGYSSALHWIGWTRTAYLASLSSWFRLRATPAFEGRSCLDLIQEIVNADMAMLWLDEHDTVRMLNRAQADGSKVVSAVNSQTQAFNYSLEDSGGRDYTSVTVKYQEATTSSVPYAGITVWEGSSSQSISGGETVQLVAEPAAGEDWVYPDLNPRRVAPGNAPDAAPTFTEVNRGRGSYYGGVVVDQDGEVDWAGPERLDVTTARLSDMALKMAFRAQAIGADQTIDLRTLKAQNTAMWDSRSDKPMPVIRAKGRIIWTGQSVTVGSGDDLAEYEHDAGVWVQEEGDALEMGQYILNLLTSNFPTITDLDIVPDFRLQRGDKIAVKNIDGQGTEYVGTMSGKHIEISPGSLTMKLDISVRERLGTLTYAEVDAERANNTYSQVQVAQGSTTYQNEITP